MKNWKYYILMLIATLLVGACSEEEDFEQDTADVDFCVRAAWQNGLGGDNATRAFTTTNILTDGLGDIVISTDDYPTTINVKCSDNTEFTLTKGSALCSDHSDYWQYTPSKIYKDKKIERDDLMFTCTATIDGDDKLEGVVGKDDISDKTSSGQRHMLVKLHHTKALLRFAFKVSEKYDKIRNIRVTKINLNDAECKLVDKVLTTSGQFIAYAYIDPAVVTVNKENTIQCTYNIYDKDDVTDEHLTRKGVVAQNKFILGSLKDASSNEVLEIEAGYYYDLKVTLNPDYLYVLSEHDNKHLTIN